MRILITGATGFIGRRLVEQLINGATAVGSGAAVDSEAAVTILLRESYSVGQPLPPNLAAVRSQIDVVYADLRHFNQTRRAIRQAKPERVIHLAAAGATDPFLNFKTALRHNLDGTLNLLRACFERSHTTQQLIVCRTPGEYHNINVYAASKAAAWNFCQMYAHTQSWPIHGAMIFQAYGPGQPMNTLIPAALTAAQAGHDFPMTAGKQKRDWIYVDDVATGLLAALNSPLCPGDTFDLGTGQLTSVADVVGLIYALTGRGGRPLIGQMPDRPGKEPAQVADVAQTKALLNWQAALSLQEGLSKIPLPIS